MPDAGRDAPVALSSDYAPAILLDFSNWVQLGSPEIHLDVSIRTPMCHMRFLEWSGLHGGSGAAVQRPLKRVASAGYRSSSGSVRFKYNLRKI